MKRDILRIRPDLSPKCCPGHDLFPVETYESNRSKRARARDIKKEHRMARRLLKLTLNKELDNSE